MSADSGYKEARAISEAAREQDWKLPSFGKGLYLGDFQPELISPQPELPAEAIEKGERFLATLGAFLRDEVDPQAIERDGQDLRRGGRRIQGDRRPRHEGARAVRRPRALAGLLQPRADAGRDVALQRLDAAVGAPVDRAGAAPAAVRLGGAEARVAAEGLHYARVRLRADRARRGLRPREGVDHRDAHRGRRGLPPQRPQAVDDQRDGGRRPRRAGQGPPQRGSPGRHHRLHRPELDRRHGRRGAHRVHGAARYRELPDPVHRRLRAEART